MFQIIFEQLLTESLASHASKQHAALWAHCCWAMRVLNLRSETLQTKFALCPLFNLGLLDRRLGQSGVSSGPHVAHGLLIE